MYYDSITYAIRFFQQPPIKLIAGRRPDPHAGAALSSVPRAGALPAINFFWKRSIVLSVGCKKAITGRRKPNYAITASSDRMTEQEIVLAQQQYLFPCVFHFFKEPLVVARAKDQFVWDARGNQYLDFFGGIVTISVGHCNETVNRKVAAQIDTLQHVSTVFANEPQVALAQRVAGLTPGGKLTKSFFTNSGTEANETAILTARCYTGSHEVVALRHSYHGRSALAMAATGQGVLAIGRRTRRRLHSRIERVLLPLPARLDLSELQRALRAGYG